jgi:hypothetical protein
MCRGVDLPQPAPRQVRVALGRRQRRVTEQLLDDADVRTALEQVGREGVPQRVRGHVAEAGCVAARPTAVRASRAPRRSPRVLSSSASVVRGPSSAGRPVGEVVAERVDRRLAERGDPFLRALAEQPHLALREVQGGEVERAGLGHAGAAGVQQLEQGPVPQPDRRRGVGGDEQAVHLVDRRTRGRCRPCLGEASSAAGSRSTISRRRSSANHDRSTEARRATVARA